VFAKKSFLTCSPSVDGTIITFSASSEFHREKVDQTEVKSQLTKAISEMFGVEGYQVRVIKSGGTTQAANTSEKASVDDFLNF